VVTAPEDARALPTRVADVPGIAPLRVEVPAEGPARLRLGPPQMRDLPEELFTKQTERADGDAAVAEARAPTSRPDTREEERP